MRGEGGGRDVCECERGTSEGIGTFIAGDPNMSRNPFENELVRGGEE